MIYRLDNEGLHCLDARQNGDYILILQRTPGEKKTLFLDVYYDIWVHTSTGPVLLCVDPDGIVCIPFATYYGGSIL